MKLYIVGFINCDSSVELDVNDLRDLNEEDGSFFFNKKDALKYIEEYNNPDNQIVGSEDRAVMMEVEVLSFTTLSASPKLKTVKVKK